MYKNIYYFARFIVHISQQKDRDPDRLELVQNLYILCIIWGG